MKEKVFVFISSDSVIINTSKHEKVLNFNQHGIREANPNIITRIIYDFLESIGFNYEEVVLVLSEDYISIKESVVNKSKNNRNSNKPKQDFHYSIIENPIEESNLEFAKYTDFVSNGNVFNEINEIHTSQKYYQRVLKGSWKTEKLNTLLELLLEKDINITYLLPLSLFVMNNSSAEIFISFYENQSFISIVKEGVIRKTVVATEGLMKIREDISNKFNVSLKVAEKLLELYGYVFLPSKYVEYVVDIPIYDKIVQSIEFTDLSYCIRESAKALISEAMSTLDRKYLNIDSNVIINANSKIRGFEKLMGLMMNKSLVDANIKELNYSELLNAFNFVTKYDTIIEEEQILVPEPLVIEKEESYNDVMSLKERIAELVESKLKPIFVEAIV